MAKLKTESAEPKTAGDLRNSNTAAMLYSYVERYERLQEEKDALGDDQKEVMAEAKGLGFDTAIMRMVIRRRKMDAATRLETDSMLELYEDIVSQQTKKQVEASVSEGGEPTAANKSWGRKVASADPRQTDIEDVSAPTAEEVQEEAARQVVHAAEHPDAPDVGNIPSFLRRSK